MKIKRIILRILHMNLLNPFVTSFGKEIDREFILVEIQNQDGLSGWAESVACADPFYKEETVKTNLHIMEDFLIPILQQATIQHPAEVLNYFAPIRGNYMAKSGLESAIWDLYAREKNISLAKALGGNKQQISVGLSIGIQDSIDDLLHKIESGIEEGYKRIKIKIKPGWDIDVTRRVRQEFPDFPLMVDANSAYTLNDTNHLAQLDEFNLMMIEQPLAHDDIIDHATLQSAIKTPICLDESIHSAEDARKAIQLGATKIINIKIGRVGGLTEAKKIHDLCQAHHIPVWCGGMLEAGVGRAHNIALATLDNFVLPGDTAASSKYWQQDIINPEVIVENGLIHVPQSVGIGFEPDRHMIKSLTKSEYIFEN